MKIPIAAALILLPCLPCHAAKKDLLGTWAWKSVDPATEGTLSIELYGDRGLTSTFELHNVDTPEKSYLREVIHFDNGRLSGERWVQHEGTSYFNGTWRFEGGVLKAKLGPTFSAFSRANPTSHSTIIFRLTEWRNSIAFVLTSPGRLKMIEHEYTFSSTDVTIFKKPIP